MLLRLPLSVLGIVTFKIPSLNEALAFSAIDIVGQRQGALIFAPGNFPAEILAFFLFLFLGGWYGW